jgi:hypothetical protein
MGPRIRAFDPGMTVSTYPLGSAGLSWLRRRGELPVPAGAWVAAFRPHPSWLYPNLDVTYVMHRSAAQIAAQAEPQMCVGVGACRSGRPSPPLTRPPPGPAGPAR